MNKQDCTTGNITSRTNKALTEERNPYTLSDTPVQQLLMEMWASHQISMQ